MITILMADSVGSKELQKQTGKGKTVIRNLTKRKQMLSPAMRKSEMKVFSGRVAGFFSRSARIDILEIFQRMQHLVEQEST